MELNGRQVGPESGERVEHVMPGRLRQQQHVVRRRGRLRPGGRVDLLEQRVGLRQVDDAVDAHACRAKARSADAYGVAGAGVQVRCGLLGDQDAGRRAGERAQLPGKRASIAVREAQDDTRPGGLRRGPGTGEPAGLTEGHRQCHAYARGGPDRGEHSVRIRAAAHLYLPRPRCRWRNEWYGEPCPPSDLPDTPALTTLGTRRPADGSSAASGRQKRATTAFPHRPERQTGQSTRSKRRTAACEGGSSP